MTHHVGPPPPAPNHYGYSCQVWFMLQIIGELFGANTRWLWFAVKFNPLDNVDSSNPCLLYFEVSRAVHQNDVGSRIIRGYRAALLDMIGRREDAGQISPAQASTCRARITAAPVQSFRPEVWRLDLRAISRRRYGSEDVDQLRKDLRAEAAGEVRPPQVLQPDEYLIKDLQAGEYEVIIVG